MNSNNPVFGMEGDFITSPEISQVFGEVCGEFEFSMTREMTNSSPTLRSSSQYGTLVGG